MTDSIKPDNGPPPPTTASKRTRVAESLESLFSVDEGEREVETIPGAADSFYPNDNADLSDIGAWASDLEGMAKELSSALSKSRALLVASHLYRKLGEAEKAYECARTASETSPRLGLAALTLRKRARERGDKETVVKSLEAAARHASDPSTRTHAFRQLASHLEAEGQLVEAGQILDQAAHSGDADDALRFARIVHRMGQGESLAGLEIPDKLREAVAITQEVIGGARRSINDTTAPQSPELKILRAARHLADNDTAETMAWLRQTELPEPALLELEAELCAAEPDGKARAIQVLQDLTAREPSRRILRRFAELVAGSNARTDLFKVLQRADPGSGTFSIEERWLLSSWGGQRLELGRDDMLSLSEKNLALAIALGPTELPAPNVANASDTALLVQLGAGLLRLRKPETGTPLSESALLALEELKRRGSSPYLTSSVDLILAKTAENHHDFAESLRALSDEPSRASGSLIAGAVFQHAGAADKAEQAYRLALTGRDEFLFSASRGLFELGADDASSLLEKASTRTEDPQLCFAQKLIALYHSPLQGRAHRTLDALRKLLDSPVELDAEGTSELLANESALLLALTSAVSLADEADEDTAKAADFLGRRALSPQVGQLVRLREHWEALSSPEGTNTSPSRDPAARMLAFFQGSKNPMDPSDELASPFRYPASEILLYLARSIILDDLQHAAELGSLCAEVERATGAIGVDMHKVSGHTAELTPLWLERVKSEASDSGKLYAYERLVELDEQLGDRQGAHLWLKTLVEEFPHHLPSLLKWEERLFAPGQSMLPATERLALASPQEESEAYRLTFGARALSQSDLRSARKHFEPFLDMDAPPLLSLRGLATVAHEKRDDSLLLRVYEKLSERPGTDLDRACRALTVALIHARMGNLEQSIHSAERAVEEKPGAFAAHQLLAYLKDPDDSLMRAEQLEALAQSAAAHAHRSELFFLAGQAFDAADDSDRAAECYEYTLESSPDHQEAFSLLVTHREARGSSDLVEKLVLQRLSLIKAGSQEHLELELKLATLLSQQGRAEEAKKHLEEALSYHPGHPGALRAHADVSAQLGAHESAEKSLMALRDRLEPGEERILVMRSLAHLYDEHLGQAEKAMDAYQALLQEAPGDEPTRADLVRSYCKLGLAERATNLQTQIIQEATSPEKKRDGALLLANIYEFVAHDAQRASATLERTRKAWPLDADVLEATVLFMDRHGTGGSRGFLLDRAGKDARRQLESGRLDAGLLDTLARVARLSGQETQAAFSDVARHAYLGSPHEPFKAAGLSALDPRIDEIIAPHGLPSPLRTLLRKTGAAMDAAFSVDLSAIGAVRLTEGATFDRVAQIARAFGSDAPELFVSKRLGPKCLPLTTEPARLLLGADLDTVPERERDYLLLRALKLRWLGAGALSRSKDEDRFPMLVALLHLFAPNWQPKAVDGRKAAQARALIEQGLARVGYDDDVPLLALEVIGALGADALGNQSSNVGELPRILANRVALLGLGDPGVALQAMARTEGSKLATGGPSRFRFIESRPEARDVLLFCTTDKCARACEALGLAGSGSSPQASRVAPSPAQMATRAPALPRRTSSTPVAPDAPQAQGSVDPATEGGAPPPPRRPPPPKRS